MTDANVSKGDSGNSLSSSLLIRLKARQPEAWERLVALYNPVIYGWCRKARLQEADAADVGQEIFRAVYRGITGFERRRQGGTFRGWLRTITRNKLRDFARRKRIEIAAAGGSDAHRRLQQVPSDDVVEEATAPCADESGSLRQRAVRLLQVQFSEQCWQAFWRVVIEDQEVRDVATDLNMTKNAVYLAKSRVLRRFREEYAELLDDLAEIGP